jgi:hypothetical protein
VTVSVIKLRRHRLRISLKNDCIVINRYLNRLLRPGIVLKEPNKFFTAWLKSAIATADRQIENGRWRIVNGKWQID